MKLYSFLFLLISFSLTANIKSTTGSIKIDINSDGIIEAEINESGLVLGETSASANLELNGTMAYSGQVVNSDTNLSLHTHVFANTSSDNIQLQLPYAANVQGQVFTIKKMSSKNSVYITADNLIDEQPELNLTTSSSGLPFVSLMSQNNQWYIVNLNVSSTYLAGDNLLMYWKFDDGDGSDTIADSSQNSYAGTLVNVSNTAFETGLYGEALRFGSGGAEYVHIENGETALDPFTEITVSAWVKSDIIGTDKGFLFGASPSGSDNRLGIRYDNGGASGGGDDVIKIGLSTDGNDISYESAALVQTTDWQHLLFTWKSGEVLKLYIDGVLDTPTSASGTISGSLGQMTDFRLGQGTKDNSGSWDGLLDEVRIYSKALNANEVTQLYQAGR